MAGCSEGCREEFKASNFLLTTERPDIFVRSQWTTCRCVPIFYVVWRAIAAITLLIMLLIQIAEYAEYEGPRYLIYLTNWSFLTLTVDSIIQLGIAIHGYCLFTKADRLWEKTFLTTPWYIKMSWVITNITSCAALIVTIVYWAALYEGQTIEATNFFAHAFNSIYVFINLWITGIPVRIYHYYHALVYALVYLIFNAVYVVITGDVIYPIYDWIAYPGVSTLFGVLLSFLGALVMWLIYYGLYRLRVFISDRIDRRVHPTPQDDKSDVEGQDNPAYTENSHM